MMKTPPATTSAITQSKELSQEERDLLALVDTPVDVELEQLSIDHITQAQKMIARARFQQMVLEELQRSLARLRERKPELSYGKIARRLRIDPALVSKRMGGCTNMTMDTAADMFLALEEYPVIFGVSFAEPRPSGYLQSWVSGATLIQTTAEGAAVTNAYFTKTDEGDGSQLGLMEHAIGRTTVSTLTKSIVLPLTLRSDRVDA
jgi:hypothetical protein